MTKEDLKHKLKQIEDECIIKRKEVMRIYCDEHNPFKIGDSFTDHIGTIRIEKVRYDLQYPCCVYFGVELKKDGSPKNSGKKRNSWQFNQLITNP